MSDPGAESPSHIQTVAHRRRQRAQLNDGSSMACPSKLLHYSPGIRKTHLQ